MQSGNTASPMEFGPYRLDPARGELTKSGVRLSLARQPLQILNLLVQRQGEIVTRETLVSALWPDGTYVDYDHGLNAAVNKLRQALSDNADSPRYIETLPGKGYRFIGALRRDQPAAPGEPAMSQPPAAEAKRLSPNWLLLLIPILVAVAWFAVTRLRQGPPIPPVVRFQVFPPEGHILEPAISRIGFAISRDGRKIAFTAMDNGGLFSAWLRDLSDLVARKLPGSDGAFSLSWGNDDDTLFLSVRGDLRELSLSQGAYRVLANSPGQLFFAVWIDAERLLVGNRRESFFLSPGSGMRQGLKEVYSWPQSLPDGRFLYAAYEPKSDRNSIRIVRTGELGPGAALAETDSRAQFVPSRLQPDRGYLMYVRNGTLLAHPVDPVSLRLLGEPQAIANGVQWQVPSGAADFSVSDAGVLVYQEALARSQLVLTDRGGKTVQEVSPPNVSVKYARLSPDGTQVAASLGDNYRGSFDVWLFDLHKKSGRRWTGGPGTTASPVWSPDGRTLAYGRAVGSPPLLVTRDLPTEGPERSLRWGFYQLCTDWSPDGRYIAFTNTAYGAAPNERDGTVWLMDLQRENRVTPLLDTPFHETGLVFSPGGRHVAFLSNDSGRTEVYVQEFVPGDTPRLTGARRQVSQSGALCVRWRRDGRELVYLGADSRFYATAMSGGTPGATEALFRLEPEALAVLPSPFGFDVSSDGQRFLVPVVAPGVRSALTVVQNWESLLARQVNK